MEAPQSDKLVATLEGIVLARVAANKLIVPSLPAVAERCLAIIKDPEFQVKKLVGQVEAEPVLAAIVLRAANSAAHGGSVKLLHQAIVRIGAQRMKSLIVEYASHELFHSSDKRIADANRKIWEHSIAVALLARDLAAFAGNPDGDTCYLGGLLHDVGKPVLAALMLEAERKIGHQRTGWIDHLAWQQAIGASHRKIGVAVAAGWNLPGEVSAAIRDCSDYDANERGCAANVVRLANAIAKREGYTTAPIDADDVDAMIMVGRSMLSVAEDVITRLAQGLRARVSQAVE
jgi:putative nucleotidyltransferase with HDIG domain